MTEDTTSYNEFDRLKVRELWPNEALDFTPWLSDNLDQLGNVIGVELESIQTEKAVGPFSLDILAQEVSTGAMVAIENQLEWSDRSHLSQLLTYAAGCDARVAIWIATEFTQEYAKVLHWLNQWSSDEVRFYGVKVEVVRNPGDSKPQPRFHKVVYPGGWDKGATLPPEPPMPPDKQKHHNFFQPLVDVLIHRGFTDRVVQAWSFRGRRFAAPFDKDSGYEVYMGQGNAWVTLHIRTWDSIDRSNRIYDELLAQRDEIEGNINANLAQDWVWQRYDKKYFSCVNVKRDATIEDPPEKLAETRAWMLDLLPKFKEVFDPKMAEILSGLPFP